MAFLLGNQIVLDDTESGHLSKLQINGTDVLTLNGSTITLKNVDIADSIEGSINSDNVAEGSTNRFFTAAREAVLTTADATNATTATNLFNTNALAIATEKTRAEAEEADIRTDFATADATTLSSAQSYTDSAVTTGTGSLDTDDITEAGNLYYTDARADVRATLRINDSTTDNIDEGSNNLYYTDTRADARAQLKIDALVDAAPGTLDTLNELAAALGDDANHVTTMTNLIGAEATTARAAEAANSAVIGVNSTNIVTVTAAVAAEITRATAAESANATAIGAETTRATAAESANAIAISVEATTARAAETANATVLTVHDTRITAVEGAVGSGNDHDDNVKVRFGTDNDLEIYHSGTESIIAELGQGNLSIRGSDYVNITDAGQNNMFQGKAGEYAKLFYNNSEKLSTTNTGVDVTGDLTATGDVTAYSDRRLKRNIETINKPLDIVNALRGVKFEKDGRHSTGVIAQEVEEVLPEVVHTDADGMKSVAYGNITGLLIEAIKEQQKQIDWLMEFWQNDAERDSFNKD